MKTETPSRSATGAACGAERERSGRAATTTDGRDAERREAGEREAVAAGLGHGAAVAGEAVVATAATLELPDGEVGDCRLAPLGFVAEPIMLKAKFAEAPPEKE